ncbi:ly6/PLAUR domain-containing protein 2-like isoform X1 [Chanodichthys erythropterus]|uniref:ly6/PLAUR domain-containing protein 2-like isoform X1 n=1 Tax=Chanodichthys erythropterus TaxID=933992 RepID=UPI00351E09F6
MMDLRISVVLLFIFLTGGYSLKCYKCKSDSSGSCDAVEETCSAGSSKCLSTTVEKLVCSNMEYNTTKGCAKECEPQDKTLPSGARMFMHCCDSELCNAADGVFKGSFLLLLSPLLFYFLFQ